MNIIINKVVDRSGSTLPLNEGEKATEKLGQGAQRRTQQFPAVKRLLGFVPQPNLTTLRLPLA